MSQPPLPERFRRRCHELGLAEAAGPVLVAFSGGVDSTVLFHLLRFRLDRPIGLQAAHFDHRMRPDSAADAAWAADLCARWEVPIEVGVADPPPRTEAEARDARYAFLFARAREIGAAAILTAHHADDQAETVLFRILRGTGLQGLAGIPERGRSGLVRPLLPFWRTELEEYARAEGLEWREDPTNEWVGPARNRIRQVILPEIERTVAPAARRNLVRLSRLARETEDALRDVVRQARRDAVVQERAGFVLVRSRVREYHPAVAGRLLRDLLKRLGPVPDSAGTRSIIEFITDAPSGREMHLPGGVRIRIEFDRARIEREHPAPPDEPVQLVQPEPGRDQIARLRIGGRDYRIVARLGTEPDREADREAIWRARFGLSNLRFPLLLRSRRPGDRVQTAGGTKSLKKLMLERRIPLAERARLPVLVDAGGTVAWIGGIGSFVPSPAAGETALNLAVYDD